MGNNIKYFEFSKAAYYALVASSDMKGAIDLYIEEICYDNLQQLHDDHAYPIEISKEEALSKYVHTYQK